jgi:hypothetical protein
VEEPAFEAGWVPLAGLDPALSPAFTSSVARAFGLTARGYLVRDAGTARVAGAQIFERRRGPFRAAVVPAFTPYTPWLGAPPGDEAVLQGRRSVTERLLETLESDYDQARLHLPPSVRDVRPFQWRGWRVTPYYTYRIALDAGLEARWSASVRRRVGSAGRRFHFAQDPSAAAILLTLSRESYARHGRRYPVAPEALASAINDLQQRGLLRIYTVRQTDSSEAQAAVGLLHAPTMGYYWIAGGRPGDAMTVLLGRLLPALRDEGVTLFDFVGANTPSIAEFKRRFGGVLTPYFAAERISNPVLRAFARMKLR